MWGNSEDHDSGSARLVAFQLPGVLFRGVAAGGVMELALKMRIFVHSSTKWLLIPVGIGAWVGIWLGLLLWKLYLG
jgi:hypothetical protein